VSEDWISHAAARLAPVALRRSLQLRRGASLVIETWTANLPVAEAIWLAARRQGILPTLIVQPTDAFFAAQRSTTPANANRIGQADLATAAAADGYVYVEGHLDYARLDTMPAKNRREFDRRFREWTHRLKERPVPKLLFFVPSRTAPPAAPARADVGPWRKEWVRAALVPPGRMRRTARPWMRALHRGRTVRLDHPNGTHLELGLFGAPPVLQDGVVDAADLTEGWTWTSLPSGVLSVALDARIAEGVLLANRPSRHRRGSIDRLRWTFRGGRLVRYEARRGLALLDARYRRSGPERVRPAVLSIGLNPELHDLPFMEDQERGAVTLYLGHNEDFGGHTRGSFRAHAIVRGANLSVDGRPLLRAGRRA
jgi:leucyl aminopeptidase (aminopeptidase T)